MGGGDRHTFEAVMFVIVRVVVCSGQWTGGCVTCRLTFGQEIILCCCEIVGNVSQSEPRSACTASRQAEIAGKCHSADGLCERQVSWSRGGYEDREWSEGSQRVGDRVGV